MSGSTFWKKVKPYLTKEGHHNRCDLQLSEGGRIITDQKEVAETINNYFINVAVDIENKIKPDNGYVDHPGINNIREHLPQNQNLSFRHINENEEAKILQSLNPKKATGPDKIPPKLIKMAKPVISDTIAGMINNAIDTGTFPDALKKADVTQVFERSWPYSFASTSKTSLIKPCPLLEQDIAAKTPFLVLLINVIISDCKKTESKYWKWHT